MLSQLLPEMVEIFRPHSAIIIIIINTIIIIK